MSVQSQKKPAKWLLNRYSCEHLIFTQSSLLKWPEVGMQRDTPHILKHFNYLYNMKDCPTLVTHMEEMIQNGRISRTSTSHGINK